MTKINWFYNTKTMAIAGFEVAQFASRFDKKVVYSTVKESTDNEYLTSNSCYNDYLRVCKKYNLTVDEEVAQYF